MPGVIGHATDIIEHPRLIADRLVQYAGLVGKENVEGTPAYKLKVTLKNGDIYYYYLDPDSALEIRVETQRFIRGSVRENMTELGSYKPVAGVMTPFSIESGPKNNPDARSKITVEKVEANVPIDDSQFKMSESPKPVASR